MKADPVQLWNAVRDFLLSMGDVYGDKLPQLQQLVSLINSYDKVSHPGDLAKFRVAVCHGIVDTFFGNEDSDKLIVELGGNPSAAKHLVAKWKLPLVMLDKDGQYRSDFESMGQYSLPMHAIFDLVEPDDLPQVWLHLLKIGGLLQLPHCVQRLSEVYTIMMEQELESLEKPEGMDIYEKYAGIPVSEDTTVDPLELDKILPTESTKEAEFIHRIASVIKTRGNAALSGSTDVGQAVHTLMETPDILKIAEDLNNSIMSGDVEIGSIVNLIQSMSEKL